MRRLMVLCVLAMLFAVVSATSAWAESWKQMSGAAKDIGIGANGAVWVIGTNAAGGGFGIWKWDGADSWKELGGAAVRIAVDPKGNPWVVNDQDGIWHHNGVSWTQLPGAAKDIGVGADGTVWVIGTNKAGGGYGLWKWDGASTWIAHDGAAVRIAVDPKGNPWVVNDQDHIWRHDGTKWTQLPGAAKDIGVGADGTVWVIGTNKAGGGYGLWKWNGMDNWTPLEGAGLQISVTPKGKPWVVNDQNTIWQRTE